MKLFTRIGILICFLAGFSSCIELTDELTVNEDGSGILKISLDLGMVAGAMNKDNTQFDVSFLEKVKVISSGAGAALTGAEGISNVKSVTDEKMGYYSVSMDFDNSKNLNKALYKLFGQEKNGLMPSFMKISRHKVVKTNLSPYIQKAFKSMKNTSTNEMLYSFVNVNSIVHFPSDIKNAKNIKSKLDGARTLSTSFTLQELLKGGFDFGNSIKF